MVDKVVQALTSLAKIPGLAFLRPYADKMTLAKHKVRDQVENVAFVREDIEEARENLGLGGGGAASGAPGGAVPGTHGAVVQPFGEGSDHTVIRPKPGGRSPLQSPAQAPVAQPVHIEGSGLNPLVDGATSLFALVGQLRGTSSHPNADGLRHHAVQQMQRFDATVKNAGAPPEAALAARYSLCTLIDETVLSTPWGMETQWSAQTLLSTFHKEVFGGEKFFLMLERVVAEPARNLHLLEFMYLCMALGLEGRYRVAQGGGAQLERVKHNAYEIIRAQRGDYERGLSPRWRGIEKKRSGLVGYVPLWVLGALVGVTMLAVYFGFNYMLNKNSDPTFANLAQIGRGAQATVTPPVPVKPVQRTLTLREVLSDDVAADRLDIEEHAQGTQLRIRGDGLFKPGSASISDEFSPLLTRIGEALEQFPGQILVTGHTDNIPMSVRMQVRFPSNWHLSQARAESVAALMASVISDRSRLLSEGRGDAEPRASNDTAQGRAQNRRVEISLRPTGQGS